MALLVVPEIKIVCIIFPRNIFFIACNEKRTQIRGNSHRIFIFSWKPPLGARDKISLEGESWPGARVAVAAAVAVERAMLAIYCTVQQLR